MHKQLTRKALYDLVWTKPRTELAKQFNISDVAVGKLCRQMNVPAPPPGYWAHVTAGGQSKRKFVKPPLTYTVAERIDEDHEAIRAAIPVADTDNLVAPLPPPPSVQESLSDSLERYRGLVSAVPLPRPTRGQHPVIEKLVKEDQRLAAQATTYSWQQPKYQSPLGKQLLAGLNQLLWWWSDLGFKPSSSGTRHIRLYVTMAGYGLNFELTTLEPSDVSSKSKGRSSPTFQLWFDVDARYARPQGKPALTFAGFEPEVFVSMAMLLIERRESSFRDWLKRDYDYRTWKRTQALEKDQKEKDAERQRREAEAKALLEARQHALDSAIDGVNRANDIRALVQALERRTVTDPSKRAGFDYWKAWALAEAEALDIRTRSMEEVAAWIAGFRLSVGNDVGA